MARKQQSQYLDEKTGQSYGVDEKTSITSSHQADSRGRRKMLSARRFVLGLLLLLSLAFGLVTAAYPNEQPGGEESTSGEGQVVFDQEESSFAKLLSSASPVTLHRLLHTYFPGTFKHGVYPSDESAVEAVHSNDAALAISLVQLARRQDNSSTTGSASTVTTTIVDGGTTIVTTTTADPTPTTKDPTTTQAPTTTQVTTTITPTTTPEQTTTVQQGSTVTQGGTTVVQGGTTVVQGGTTVVQGGSTVVQTATATAGGTTRGTTTIAETTDATTTPVHLGVVQSLPLTQLPYFSLITKPI
ncbi:hypothetical protein BJ170DRAFT_124925 [Xylariales sp. AK1849]|nr:hypothetical protein BJ170DRAFT_124925 [Xylariales sp. AK1849]